MSSNINNVLIEAYSNIENIHSIEEQRTNTMADPKFQQWCKDMRVSQLYTNRELIQLDTHLSITPSARSPKWLRAFLRPYPTSLIRIFGYPHIHIPP